MVVAPAAPLPDHGLAGVSGGYFLPFYGIGLGKRNYGFER